LFHVIIPARFGSARLPGKPLALIGDQPLIQWVWRSAVASGAASVLIATDDDRIYAAASKFGAECLMTSAHHASGTDRIAEVARIKGFTAEEIVVNLQGDEPAMPPEVISKVAQGLGESASRDMAGAEMAGADMASAVAPIESLQEFLDPNCVKALRSGSGAALYFSRAPVPWPRDAIVNGAPTSFAGAWRHIGIYAYRVRTLLQFAAWPPTPLETTEKLEQLRALEHGMHIHLVTLPQAPPAGVDTPADLERARAVLLKR
jgi:3-deoxy-manno-octulosonate cytidylyltransferase (CMP-KDO synthetase)